jgi:hypothetical protein
MNGDWFAEAQRAAPHKPPEIKRAARGPAAVRFGVWGKRSPTSSKIARIENRIAAHVALRNARGESGKDSKPMCAAQATAAGAVSARRPATTPIPKAKNMTEVALMKIQRLN